MTSPATRRVTRAAHARAVRDAEHGRAWPWVLGLVALLVLALAGLAATLPGVVRLADDGTRDAATGAAVDALLPDDPDPGPFATELDADDLSARLEQSLQGTDVAPDDLAIDLADDRLHVTATVDDAPLRAVLRPEVEDGVLALRVEEIDLDALDVPGWAQGAARGQVEDALDLEEAFAERGVTLEAVEVDDGALRLRGQRQAPRHRPAQPRRASAASSSSSASSARRGTTLRSRSSRVRWMRSAAHRRSARDRAAASASSPSRA